ncbi:hypothetical protein PM082_012084 [Marasmius tenuissimus]|nr:hypothetical protein PM082_012084 [Marasmius tenuissimus]
MFLQARLTVPLLVAAIALANPASEQYDYVIIGGGTAGLTAAARLTENSRIKVAVIEAGGTGIGKQVKSPLLPPRSSPYTFTNSTNITDLRNRYLPAGTQVDWVLPTVPQISAGGRVYTQVQGKALGGSSAINGAVYLRPDAREFDAIEGLGAKGWTWEKFLEYFKRSEHFTTTGETFGLEPNTSAHGTDGPVHVSFQHDISSFFAEYAIPTIQSVNQPLNGDNSAGYTVGATPQQVSVYDGTYNRSYAANAYYFPNQNRENLKVFTDSLVSKIVWGENENGLAVATGVEYIAENGTESLNAKNVIVSAGALNTPKVLELSGIGEASRLESLGIDVKVDNAGVGNNLQNQLGVNILFKLKEGVVKGPETQAPIIDLVAAQQVLTEEDQANSAEILSTPNDAISQTQFDALKKLIADGLPQTEINWSLQNSSDGTITLQFYTTTLHTFSRGFVHANSSDPQTKPIVNPDYLSSKHDLFYLARSVLYVRNYTATEPLASLIESETAPGANYTTAEDVEQWLMPNFRTMSHFVGTSAALPQEDGGVVDPETLVVYGTSNVRVADCSVVPLLPGIHTESIAYAIGEWAADILKQESN